MFVRDAGVCALWVRDSGCVCRVMLAVTQPGPGVHHPGCVFGGGEGLGATARPRSSVSCSFLLLLL